MWGAGMGILYAEGWGGANGGMRVILATDTVPMLVSVK